MDTEQVKHAFGLGACASGSKLPSVQSFLEAGSPVLALARAKGALWQRRIYQIRTNMTSATAATDEVVLFGSDTIIQDTWVTGVAFNLLNEGSPNETAFSTLSDFFYNFQSGVEATLEVTGSPAYAIAPDFTPLPLVASCINREDGYPFVLSYTENLKMQFQPRIAIPTAILPLQVVVAFHAMLPVSREFVGARMSNAMAIAQLRDCYGVPIDKSYEECACARDK